MDTTTARSTLFTEHHDALQRQLWEKQGLLRTVERDLP